MSDWHDELRNAGLTPSHQPQGGGKVATCKDCGKELPPGKNFERCWECHQKHRARQGHGAGGGTPPAPSAPPFGGYFDEAGRYRREIYEDEAMAWASALHAQRMTPAALRRFYNQLRAVETALKAAHGEFDEVRPQIWAFKRDAAYALARQVVPQLFVTFIDKNVEEGAQDKKHFLGFIEFYKSVIAYFKR